MLTRLLNSMAPVSAIAIACFALAAFLDLPKLAMAAGVALAAVIIFGFAITLSIIVVPIFRSLLENGEKADDSPALGDAVNP